MPRAYLNLPAGEVRDISRAGFKGAVIEHIPTRIVLYVDNMRTGYYARCEDYSIDDPMPFILRSDMPTLYRIEHQETMNRSLAASYSCGHFVCDTGTVKISEIGVRFEVNIAADSVDNFNMTIQALKNGELKPAGSEQTVFEMMSDQLNGLQLAYSGISSNFKECLALYSRLNHFLFLARECLACRGDIPVQSGIKGMDLLTAEIYKVKNKTFWQRLWNLPPTTTVVVMNPYSLNRE